jgi:signal transduction histidine kinase
VEEVFANLISNAIKYKGKNNTNPIIQVRGALDGKYVRFEIEDNGQGIPPEKQQQIFEMFSRASEDDIEGTGLGLAIVQRIVLKLHGQIGVTSEYGRGSTFWFTLPGASS